MKMKKIFLLLVTTLINSTAFSQSLQDQINAVNGAYQSNQNAEQARIAEQQRQAAAAQAKRDAAAAEQARIAAKDKARNQAFEDEQRALDLEERKASVAGSRAHAKRANDYIDADLKKKNAQTDVIQSEADANRNISKGAGDMLSGVGKGAAKGLPNQTTNNNTNVLFK
jgi:multidrug resistance efflux pump